MAKIIFEKILKQLKPCKCGNTNVVSQQACEDMCEIFIKCGVCNHDPCNIAEHIESVMGGITPRTVAMAIEAWNEAIARGTPPEEPPTPAPRRNCLTPEQCAQQFEMYARSHKNPEAIHQLNFCATFIREMCIQIPGPSS